MKKGVLMTKKEIIREINKGLKEKNINFKLNDKAIDVLVLDVSRVADSKITDFINTIKEDKGLKITSLKKEKIRKKY